MKKHTFFLTSFLLMLIVAGCRATEFSLFEPVASGLNSNDPLISQAKTSALTEVISIKDETDENNLTLTPPSTQNSTGLVTLEWTSPAESPTPIVVNQLACYIRSDWPVYIVKRGDTLARIAQLTNTSTGTLAAANCLVNPDRIFAGRKLHVPQIIPTPEPPTPIPTPSLVPQWIHYADPIYQAEFDYPATWQQVADGINIRFEGVDGFVQLIAIGSYDDLDEVTYNQAHHRLMPYGANPIIQHYYLMDDREARLILPSANQLGAMDTQAALIMRYVHPINILGTECNYFMMVADAAHIHQIAGTLVLPVLTVTLP